MRIVCLENLGIHGDMLAKLTLPFLEEEHEIVFYDKTTDVETLKKEVDGAEALILANMPLPGEVIQAAKDLKFIDIAFTGVDHVDIKTAKAQGIVISNAAGYATHAVAELAVGMMIGLMRSLPEMGRRCLTGGTKEGLPGLELGTKTVGILGAGAIGTETGRLCHAFGCRVLAYKRHVTGQEPDFLEFVSMEELLQESDIVSLHCPLNDATRHLINEETIAMMKSGAYVVNTARGPVVDSLVLAEALQSGRIAGAALDVFDQEPPLDAADPLLCAPNVLVTPHIGFATQEAMESRAKIVFDNLRQFLQGTPVNLV